MQLLISYQRRGWSLATKSFVVFLIESPAVSKGVSENPSIQLRLFEMEINRLNFCNKLLPISIHCSATHSLNLDRTTLVTLLDDLQG